MSHESSLLENGDDAHTRLATVLGSLAVEAPGQRHATQDERLLSLCVGITLVGGVIIFVNFYAQIAPVVALVGAALFALGVVFAGFLGFRISRRTGAGVLRSLARGLRMLFAWLWRFMP